MHIADCVCDTAKTEVNYSLKAGLILSKFSIPIGSFTFSKGGPFPVFCFIMILSYHVNIYLSIFFLL